MYLNFGTSAGESKNHHRSSAGPVFCWAIRDSRHEEKRVKIIVLLVKSYASICGLRILCLYEFLMNIVLIALKAFTGGYTCLV